MRQLEWRADHAFEAVIFDLDGTLIDSTAAIDRSWLAWMKEFGVDPNLAERHHGVPAAEIVRALLADQERQPEAIQRIHELETTDVAGVIALPGAKKALAALHHARSAIATSGTLALARARIAAAALVPPSVLVTADDVRRGKPAPDPFLEAARRLGVNPGRCLVVEDAPQGLAAATAAGCATLAVLTTTSRENLYADFIIPDLSTVTFEVSAEGIRVHSRTDVA